MCLSLLSPDYFRISFLGESIVLDVRDGDLEVTEVYDLFFKLNESRSELRLLAVSPHDLVKDGELCVEAVGAPGAGSVYDDIYRIGTGRKAKWDRSTRLFSVSVTGYDRSFAQTAMHFSGRILQPHVALPDAFATKPVLQIMKRSGTVFEMVLPQVDAGVDYAIRFRVKPNRLLGLAEKRAVQIPFVDRPTGMWCQDLEIYCTKTCHFNVTRLVEKAREKTECAEAAGAILAEIHDEGYSLLPIDEHRMVVASPVRAEIEPLDEHGWILPMGSYSFSDGGRTRRAAEWKSSTEMYWSEDIEALARAIWAHLSEWAGSPEGAKKKEEVTAAVGMAHENCSLVIDALCERGALIRDDTRYHVRRLNDEEARHLFRDIASNKRLAQDFDWNGYRITYCVKYQHLAPEARAALRWYRFRTRSAFWLAILGILVGLASPKTSVAGRESFFKKAGSSWPVRVFIE